MTNIQHYETRFFHIIHLPNYCLRNALLIRFFQLYRYYLTMLHYSTLGLPLAYRIHLGFCCSTDLVVLRMRDLAILSVEREGLIYPYLDKGSMLLPQ